MWSVPRGEPGCTVVLAGGPSVLDADLSLLRGRRVIAINSAWRAYPEADFLFFADARWWRAFGYLTEGFTGRIVTVAAGLSGDRILNLKKVPPPGLSLNPRQIAMQWTSIHGAINLAVHLGAEFIVLLGADGKMAGDRRHHHDDLYPWPLKPGCFDLHKDELTGAAESLKALGVTVINASPGSAWDVWPVTSLPEALPPFEGNTCNG